MDVYDDEIRAGIELYKGATTIEAIQESLSLFLAMKITDIGDEYFDAFENLRELNSTFSNAENLEKAYSNAQRIRKKADDTISAYPTSEVLKEYSSKIQETFKIERARISFKSVTKKGFLFFLV